MTFFAAPTLTTFYKAMLAIALLFLAGLYGLVLSAYLLEDKIVQGERERTASLRISGELLQSSHDLSRMARLYTMRAEPRFRQYYFDIIRIREAKLARPLHYTPAYWDKVVAGQLIHQAGSKVDDIRASVQALGFSKDEIDLLDKALKRSELYAIENRAFNLMSGIYPDTDGLYVLHGKVEPEVAQKLLFDDDYLAAQNKLSDWVDEFSSSLDKQTSNYLKTLLYQQVIVFRLIQVLIILFIMSCAYAYWYSTKRVIRPIYELHQQAARIAQGDYEVRNHIHVENELETLAETFNEMCDQIVEEIKIRTKLNTALTHSESQFRNALESAPIGMGIKALDGRWLQVNQVLCDLLGYSKDALLVLPLKALIYKDDLEKNSMLEQSLIRGERSFYQIETRYLHKEGHEVWVLSSASLMRDSEGRALNLISQIHDIGPRKLDEKRMVELHQQMSETLIELQLREQESIKMNKMIDMLQTCQTADEAYSVIFLNAKALFPYQNGGLAILNKSTNRLETVCQWGSPELLLASFKSSECWALRNGNSYLVDEPADVLLCQHFEHPPHAGYIDIPLTAAGEVLGLFMLLALPGQRLSLRQQQLAINFSEGVKLSLANINLRVALREQALRDALTGLFNRRYLDETMPRELERSYRHQTQLSLAVIDIDYFKRFNDDYGHDAGDEVLKAISALLAHGIRKSDLACRYGGEEFVIVFVETCIEDALGRMTQICQEVKHTQVKFKGQTLPSVSLSVGLAARGQKNVSAERLFEAADSALYKAKDLGRDQIVLSDL